MEVYLPANRDVFALPEGVVVDESRLGIIFDEFERSKLEGVGLRMGLDDPNCI